MINGPFSPPAHNPAALPGDPDFPFWNWLDAALFISLAAPCLLLSLALSRGLFLLFANPPSDAVRALVFQFLGYALWFGALYLMLTTRYHRPFLQAMAWLTPWRRPFLTIFVGPMLAVSVVILGILLGTPAAETPLQKLLRDRSSLIVLGIFATTLGPLAEELVFRGFLMPLFVRSFGLAWGIALSSVPFALLHGPQYGWHWQHLVLLFWASLVFGITRYKTGSTAASTFVHATYNLTFFTGFLLQGRDTYF